MIELIYILRAVVLATCNVGDGPRRCVIKFGDLERLVFDVLWDRERIATYPTSRELERDLERLADLGVIRYESGEVAVEDPDEFTRKVEPFLLVARNMTAGNAYLRYVIQKIEDCAREYALRNIGTAPQPA